MPSKDKLISNIDTYTLSTFPKTILLVGEYGSGKHTICKYISDKFNIELFDITSTINANILNEIEINESARLYIIDCNLISTKSQNAILKFIEEPGINTFIALLCENTNYLLPTIINRCQIWELKSFHYVPSLQILSEGKNLEFIGDILTTPGQVIKYKDINISEIFDFANKVLTQVSKASVGNILNICNYIDFKNDGNGYDYYLFIKLLMKAAYNLYVSGNLSYKNYLLLKELYDATSIPNINKQYLLEHYLMKLRIERNK